MKQAMMSVPPEMEASSRSALISLRTETGKINSLDLVAMVDLMAWLAACVNCRTEGYLVMKRVLDPK